MTIFLRLMSEKEKETSLLDSCNSIRQDDEDRRVFEVPPSTFLALPGAPFAYWLSDAVRNTFQKFGSLQDVALATSGTGTLDDFRFLRHWVETFGQNGFVPYAKGGAYSPIYFDPHLVVNWRNDGNEMKAWIIFRYGGGHWARNIRSTEHYFRPGITWPRRTNGLSFRIMPEGCIFADKGPAIFTDGDDVEKLLALCAIVNTRLFGFLVSAQLARTELAQSFEVGLIQQTPIPDLSSQQQSLLSSLCGRAWSLMHSLDTIVEASHAFFLPASLRARLGDYDPPSIEAELAAIHSEIDDIAFDLYGFSDADRAAALRPSGTADKDDGVDDETDSENDDVVAAIDQTDGLHSWAVGVAFGRFDWRLATGERDAPPEPEPFDPLPTKSPGMLPDDAEPFYAHSGILVDDQGHPADLAHLIEEVLARVDAPVPADVRRWLQRDFFPLHMRQYSKSRRKAPIYWPISTTSGNYTLWLYYPSLTDQTLFTAVNDFIEPKLKQVGQDVSALRTKGSARSRDDEKTFEALQTLELELIELRDTLLAIAQTYRPNHDDGVQITAAPLGQLFRHKPWQKILKDTWAKLEKGDYDWAHLAMAYWPDRVREKCETDKSLAIAHDLEHLYVEPESTKARGRKKDG
jgi:hypothetical protein